MANRRMFSLKIIDTDLFLDMPVSSQLLYFHLSMRADDDGFVSSPKKIIKMVNCSEDDFKILMAKNFVIPFESGICVIKHWKIHNYIQNDRYNKTMYQHEKQALVDIDGTYEIDDSVNTDTECIQDGYKPDTQVRLGKVRLGKVRDSLGEIVKETKQDIKKTHEIIVCSWTTNPLFRTAIYDFIDMRKTIKKPLTEKALTLMLDKLNKLSNSDDGKIDILNQSVMNCYQGVFEVKGVSNGFKSNNSSDQGKWAGYKPKQPDFKPHTDKEIKDLGLI